MLLPADAGEGRTGTERERAGQKHGMIVMKVHSLPSGLVANLKVLPITLSTALTAVPPVSRPFLGGKGGGVGRTYTEFFTHF